MILSVDYIPTKKGKENPTDATNFHGGWPLPKESNKKSSYFYLYYYKFIDTCIKILDNNIAWRCLDYKHKTK